MQDYCVATDLGDVTGAAVATGLNGGFGNSFAPSCSIAATGGEEVILSWEAPQSGTYRFTTENSDYDTVLYFLDSCVGDEIEDACNDDEDFLNGVYTTRLEMDLLEEINSLSLSMDTMKMHWVHMFLTFILSLRLTVWTVQTMTMMV